MQSALGTLQVRQLCWDIRPGDWPERVNKNGNRQEQGEHCRQKEYLQIEGVVDGPGVLECRIKWPMGMGVRS